MNFNFEATLWYILMIDCMGANLAAWFWKDWYDKNLGYFLSYFPLTKAWCLAYLVMTSWLGSVLFRLDVLPW